MNVNELFSRLLEQYIFTVADKAIPLVDSRQQSALINLIYSIDLPASNDIPDACSEESSLLATTVKAASKRLGHIPTNQLQEQYRGILKNSSTQEKNSTNKRKALIYRAIHLNTVQIDYVAAHITKLNDILNRSQKILKDTTQKALMRNHLQLLINRQESYLVELNTVNQTNYSRLEQ